ncbi:MAG: septum formation family protein [Acidobacteria bacterium]|nr:septum formation family protein [Acidobacteriota bacterium]
MIRWVLLLGACVVFAACASSSTPPLPGNLTRFLDVAIGQCFVFDEPTTRTVAGVEIVDCEFPHTYELFSLNETAATEWADINTFNAEAVSSCAPALEIYTDTLIGTGNFDFAFFTPSVREWQDGVRTFGCYAFLLDGTNAVGSFRVDSETRRVARRALEVGACFVAPPSSLVFTVQLVDCDVADVEVLGIEFYRDGDAAYPESMPQDAQAVCDNLAAELSIEGTPTYFAPSQLGWSNGERAIVCLLQLSANSA